MIGKLLATTAFATVIAASAFAQDAAVPAGQSTTAPAAASAGSPSESGNYLQNVGTDQYIASDVTGSNLYQSTAADAGEAGEIENFLIDGKGKVLAAIVDTGSFLDDAKTVAVPVEKINWTMDANNALRPVLTASREELMAAPEFTETTAAEAAQNGAMAPASGAGTAMAPDAASTAAVAPAAGTAATAAATPDKSGYIATVSGDQRLSDTIIGSKVYGGPGADAASIGDINDLVIAKSGTVAGVVIGVGGFLGLGEKNVGVPFSELSMVNGESNEPRAILAATKDQLTAAPGFNTDVNRVAAADGTVQTGTSSMADAGAAVGGAVGSAANSATTTANNAAASAGTAVDTAAGQAGAMAQSTAGAVNGAVSDATTTASTGGAADRASMTPVTGGDLSADNLTGTTVYGPNDENIGSISDIALSQDGKVDAVILDVGGFLGIGQKSVAVAMDNLQFMKDPGGTMYLYTQFTQDQLKNAPEYNKDTYAENRGTMRVTPGALPAATAAGTAQPAAPAK